MNATEKCGVDLHFKSRRAETAAKPGQKVQRKNSCRKNILICKNKSIFRSEYDIMSFAVEEETRVWVKKRPENGFLLKKNKKFLIRKAECFIKIIR